jgi:dTDP-4-dehydrorhamnose 3,5-epimerase-like enzyme
MHLQIGEHPVNKIVSVLSGSISDFLVDTRSSSTTFLNVLNLELNHSDKKVVYIPSGVAHGYLVRESKTTVMYLYDNNFCSDCDAGFNVSSLPVMNFENTKYIRSERDSLLPSIKEFLVDTLSIEFK